MRGTVSDIYLFSSAFWKCKKRRCQRSETVDGKQISWFAKVYISLVTQRSDVRATVKSLTVGGAHDRARLAVGELNTDLHATSSRHRCDCQPIERMMGERGLWCARTAGKATPGAAVIPGAVMKRTATAQGAGDEILCA
ncbi:hypothetical protein M3I53_13010 [Paraburkholderia sp. CNPSo 3272]|uniref:hypothetical protein n=1 Tax=Paraburkholderia sp. CNPSo 3272 TaxID=2940931 RepID=UPI0020B8C62F|nr:hypothetical protein [Paraburkholderia sp. CNPSo 3272]MCP3724036.1 hypothetical protein [Paraburkholderia sp. CNPSo 3272]